MKAPKKKEAEERNKCTISCSAEGMWSNGACICLKAKFIHLTVFKQGYETVNTVIGSTQCFCSTSNYTGILAAWGKKRKAYGFRETNCQERAEDIF